MQIQVTVKGVGGAIQTVATIQHLLYARWLRIGLREGAKLIANDMKRNAPRLSGVMARSVVVRAMKRKKGRVGYLAQYSADKLKSKDGKKAAYYPGYLESGSPKTKLKAQRNARKAYERQKNSAEQAVANRIATELSKPKP